VWNVASDPHFLKARCLELGVYELEREIIRVESLCRRAGYLAKADRLSDLAKAIARESHWLRVAPDAIAAILWNRLRRAGWSERDLEVLRDGASSFLRVRSIATRASSAMIRDLRGHTSEVTACAITSDGRVVSASRDGTIRVWDIASGREISCLTDYDDSLVPVR
jgi:WD40 repeat protein